MTQRLILSIIIFSFFVCSSSRGIGTASHSEELIIYHAFDQKYSEIESLLPILSELAISHIQISPPNPSRNSIPFNQIDLQRHRKCGQSVPSKSSSKAACPKESLKVIEKRETVSWDELFNENAVPICKKKPWYLHYQPTSYEIGDTYGSEVELRELITVAGKMNPPIKIIVDVVLAHFRAPDELEKEDWLTYINHKEALPEQSKQILDPIYAYIHPHLEQLLGAKLNFSQLEDLIYPWSSGNYEGGWPSSALPALKVLHPLIREKQNAYLKKLLEMGVAGFRFDVARQLPPEIFYIVRNLASERDREVFLYGEIIENDAHILKKWKEERVGIGATAYHLFDPLKTCFSPSSSISSAHGLLDLVDANDVTFITSHDTINGGLNHYYQMSDMESPLEISMSAVLAQSFLIANSVGIPLLLPDIVVQERVQAALIFRKKTPQIAIPIVIHGMDDTNTPIQDDVLAIQRGAQGFMVINKHHDKHFSWSDILNRSIGLNGYFQEVTLTDEYVTITNNANKLFIQSNTTVPPRSVRFFVRVSD